jgi:hypothetical protein
MRALKKVMLAAAIGLGLTGSASPPVKLISNFPSGMVA